MKSMYVIMTLCNVMQKLFNGGDLQCGLLLVGGEPSVRGTYMKGKANHMTENYLKHLNNREV